jgi:hypothetical protein
VPEKKDISSLFEFSTKCAAVFTFLMGCAVLGGWWLEIDLLKFDSPHLVRMKANAAFAFFLSGISLWLAVRETGSPWNRRISQCLAFLCRKIVSDHCGTLTVGTATQGGAEFRIELPFIPL